MTNSLLTGLNTNKIVHSCGTSWDTLRWVCSRGTFWFSLSLNFSLQCIILAFLLCWQEGDARDELWITRHGSDNSWQLLPNRYRENGTSTNFNPSCKPQERVSACSLIFINKFKGRHSWAVLICKNRRSLKKYFITSLLYLKIPPNNACSFLHTRINYFKELSLNINSNCSNYLK